MIGRSNIKKYANGKDIHCGVELTINHTDAGGVELLVCEEAYKRFEVAFLFGIAYFIEYLALYKKYKIENIKITINYVVGHAPFWNSVMVSYSTILALCDAFDIEIKGLDIDIEGQFTFPR